MSDPLKPDQVILLRRAIDLADQSARAGNRPFGAVLARADGTIAAEANAQDGHDVRDWTAHSEMTALRRASALLPWDELGACTLYASAEPCPMCAGAIYWCNVSTLIFAASEPAIRALRGGHPRAAGIPIAAAAILGAAPRPITVIGPALEDEALPAHARFWAEAPAGV
jgi:tRNA(Arg) A34 adenosine deaminase TadA